MQAPGILRFAKGKHISAEGPTSTPQLMKVTAFGADNRLVNHVLGPALQPERRQSQSECSV